MKAFRHKFKNLSWQSQVLTFTNRSMKEVLDTLEKQFGVAIQVDRNHQRDCEKNRTKIQLILSLHYEATSNCLTVSSNMY